ncbi:CoxG family protein [Pseudaestuariivita rosea]|uniref:CoxG family protein n=1 Tax=Pseudaestuariivita rosea TaxID=2763263 RepID=UPI001ABBB36D|nr:carbon monoxide dehydrogenase subunit G [Pseudaestuariivita rosea]
MEMNDSREISAPPQVVWDALLNPEILKQCIPGCQEMTGSPEDGFDAVVVQKVGPVKATFKGHVKLEEMQEPSCLTMNGEGKGGAAGFAKGAAKVTLTPSDDGTILQYEVEAKVGGKLAQLGSRIIDGFSKKMADQFFTNFQNTLHGPEEEEDITDADDGDAPEEKKGWLKRLVKS